MIISEDEKGDLEYQDSNERLQEKVVDIKNVRCFNNGFRAE